MPQEKKRSTRKHVERLAALKSRMLRLMEDWERFIEDFKPQSGASRRGGNLRLAWRRNGKKNGNGNGKKNGNGGKNELKPNERLRRGRR
jgi:hypothetical protein